jgi:MHS family proline/betaine transporter-like MFS transporter
VIEAAVIEKRTRPPLLETMQDHWRVVAGFVGLSFYNAVTFYIGFVYLVSWLQMADGIAPSRALEINSFSMAILLPLVIAAGWLSDKVGRKPLLLLASLGGFLAALPLFWLLNHPSDLLAQAGQLGLVVLMAVYGGTLPVVLVEAAPASVRCTAVALGYNLCFGVFGGLSPLAATWLVERTGDEIAPAVLIMASAAVTFITLCYFRESYRMPFQVGRAAAAA